MKFTWMDDELWEFIELLLPPFSSEGRPRADNRRTINTILYVLKTRIP
jgi:transposase